MGAGVRATVQTDLSQSKDLWQADGSEKSSDENSHSLRSEMVVVLVDSMALWAQSGGNLLLYGL